MSRLDDIVARTRADLAQRFPHGLPAGVAPAQPVVRASFADALRARPDGRPRVIAELKKASPSRGLIRADFRPAELAAALADGGAAALSVLTDEPHFQGSPSYLREAAAAVGLPILRKDFVVHEVQLVEAVDWGASAVLLIAAALTPSEFRRLHRAARAMGLDVLSEVHDAAELETVLAAGAEIVGVNSRDLRTFVTDLDAALGLLGRIPTGILRVAESGIRCGADLARLQSAGADAFLIGEALMRAAHPGEALRALLDDAAAAGMGARRP
ncbi:MAG: indole-3-glycerol-phosphate synthase [Lentisphaerae bacterium]|nr:indole-3-glycerol-phosphate synthase [Lentisphaerota bacterium]